MEGWKFTKDDAVLGALLLVAAVFAVLRFGIDPEPVVELTRYSNVFKDMAHLYVGGLIGYSIGFKKLNPFLVAVGLIVVEVTAFFTLK